MKGVKTLEQQRLFLKAVGNVLANEDIGLVPDSIHIKFSSLHAPVIHDFEIGFQSLIDSRLGLKIIDECKRLGLNIK